MYLYSNGATMDIRLYIPGKERWLKQQKPVKIPVKKRIISEDLLADVGELPAKPPGAAADAAKPAAAANAKPAAQQKSAEKEKKPQQQPKDGAKQGKGGKGGEGAQKPAAQKESSGTKS